MEGTPENPSNRIFTAANMVTLARLVLVPIFFLLLISDKRVAAVVVFAVAASTDWVDGQLARRTNTVTTVGQALDPLVDRLLLAAGVLGLYWIGEIPLWIMLFVILRDVYLAGWMIALERNVEHNSFQVVFIGKLTTALLLIGFVFLLIGWPLVPGFHLIDSPYLPGFGTQLTCIGYWFVYLGLIFSFISALFYTGRSHAYIKAAKEEQGADKPESLEEALEEGASHQAQVATETEAETEGEPEPEANADAEAQAEALDLEMAQPELIGQEAVVAADLQEEATAPEAPAPAPAPAPDPAVPDFLKEKDSDRFTKAASDDLDAAQNKNPEQ